VVESRCLTCGATRGVGYGGRADVDELAHETAVREDIVGLSRSTGPNPRASFSAIRRHRTSMLSGHRRSQGPREPFAFGEWVRIYVITVTQRIELR